MRLRYAPLLALLLLAPAACTGGSVGYTYGPGAWSVTTGYAYYDPYYAPWGVRGPYAYPYAPYAYRYSPYAYRYSPYGYRYGPYAYRYSPYAYRGPHRVYRGPGGVAQPRQHIVVPRGRGPVHIARPPGSRRR